MQMVSQYCALQKRGRLLVILPFLLFLTAPNSLFAATLKILTAQQSTFPVCGSQNVSPFALAKDAGRRLCDPPRKRNYTHKHNGIGFDILDLESQACFVPDDAYRLLDEVIDAVRARVARAKRTHQSNLMVARATAIGQITSGVLTEKGFALSIPTETLGDALVSRSRPDEAARYIFDCDTGSMIYLTVAEALRTPASLVEMQLSNGDQHNYVRWQIDRKSSVNWDPNGRFQCIPPDKPAGYLGKSFSRDQTMSYVLTLRAELWVQRKLFSRALADYREAIRMFPNRPGGYSGFAWLVASKEFPGRNRHKAKALAHAKQAVALRKSADNLDTLACTYALAGDFDRAAQIEKEALEEAPHNMQYERRLQKFNAPSRMDCTGSE